MRGRGDDGIPQTSGLPSLFQTFSTLDGCDSRPSIIRSLVPGRTCCEPRVPKSDETGRVVIPGLAAEGDSLYQVVVFARLFKTRIKQIE